jgi:hypothetical protein
MKQMIPHALCLATLLFSAGHADAQGMSAAEFEAYVTGKTLYFGESGAPYGAEEYLSNRRVRWSFLDGQCQDGHWYEDQGQICFVYDNTPDPQCWSFYREGDGIRAVFENDPNSTTLYEARQSQTPMMCLGPEVGV